MRLLIDIYDDICRVVLLLGFWLAFLSVIDIFHNMSMTDVNLNKRFFLKI